MNQFVDRLVAFERRLQADMANIHNPTHLCLGQEEIPNAIHEHILPQDWVFSTHRAHGHALAKGVSENGLWDEIHGLESGLNGGFAGSQGFSDAGRNFYCSAIVGGLVGVATGAALACKLDQSDAIVVCCIGDAGTEQGVFWESVNFAALNNLPLAFICENNRMSVDSPITERQATAITPRVKAFGLSIGLDAESAFRFARSGKPSFYEHRCALACDHLNMSSLLADLGGK